MVLEFLQQNYGEDVPRVNISTIARVVKTRWDGTAPKDVELMNQYFEAKLRVKFKAKAMMRFQDLIREIDENRLPVIIWLNEAKQPPDKLWHAVVLTGYDSATQHFTYNDPWNAREKQEEVGKFIQKWGVEAKMVKLLISTETQAYLGKWISKNLDEGESADE
jgi:hypothetical protein